MFSKLAGVEVGPSIGQSEATTPGSSFSVRKGQEIVSFFSFVIIVFLVSVWRMCLWGILPQLPNGLELIFTYNLYNNVMLTSHIKGRFI